MLFNQLTKIAENLQVSIHFPQPIQSSLSISYSKKGSSINFRFNALVGQS